MNAFIEILPIIIAAVAIAAALIAFIVWFVKVSPSKKAEIIDKVLYALAIEAERLYGGKTGQAKKAQVIAWFYERYKWLAMFISADELSEWIDYVVAEMNDWLLSNPLGAANIIKGN